MAGSNSCFRSVSDDSLQLQPLFPHATRPSPSKPSDTEDITDDWTLTGGGSDHHVDNGDDSLHSSLKSTGILIREAAGSLGTPGSGDGDSEIAQRAYSRDRFYSAWALEFLLLLLAGGLFAAICLILDKYNDQELPNWDDMGITLNTLVATLATIFRSIIAFIIFNILAQLKWNWVSGRFRPVQDIQRFDDASRGVYGSLQLLPLVLRRPIALGAIAVAVVSLATGPFVQQSVQTYQCLQKQPTEGHRASIIVANSIKNGILEERIHNTRFGISIGLRTAMQDAIVNPTIDSNIASLFTCQSGNCTFDTFADWPKQPKEDKISHASAGMCSQCIDVYKLVRGPILRNKGETTGEYVAFGLQVSDASKEFEEDEVQGESRLEVSLGSSFIGNYMAIRPVGNLTWTRSVASDDFMNRARWSLGNFTIIAPSQDHCEKLDNGTTVCPSCNPGMPEGVCERANTRFIRTPFLPTDYVAATCILYPCIKYYAGEVGNGTFSERVVRDVPLRLQRPEPIWTSTTKDAGAFEWKGVLQPCWVNGTLYTSSNMSEAELEPNSTTVVQFHTKDWANESIDAQASYVNITAPLECVAQIPEPLLRVIRDQMSAFDTSCSVPRRGTRFSCSVDFLSGFLRNTSTSVATIRENMDSMAMRITTEIRKYGRGAWSEENAKVNGHVWENKSCVHISWRWMALPATLLTLCAILLLWTMVSDGLSKNGAIWKASVLPLLLRDQPGLEIMGLKGVEEAAKRLEIKIQK
ncbi:hypothetical protein NM208_g2722 [Fusarium decemcellulare]|uniref:Uncharacterized protein n=1 Tax=Fusarium decemcellulare TaxID=57161 RepID=A0ACC1SRW2_9HYPO|nr:hypothetical protein NM208_g2722 [Fusarium decemcellulare]